MCHKVRGGMAAITLERLSKVYGDGTEAVRNLDLEIGDGEFVVLVGPSGCGKTTALRMVAGLEEITDGRVWLGEKVVNRVPPKDRDIAMIFQNYALYPHMSAYANIAFALKMRKLPKPEIETRVQRAARVLGLAEVLKKRPRTLWGGKRQRVAMGRAIVREPQAFLMDEPLSNLDAKLRVEMRAEIARLQRDLDVTTIYVTHDQMEALTLGDRVAVLRDGVLQQFDVPSQLYDRPVNLFVAQFVGSPAMNLVLAGLRSSNGSLVAELGPHRLRLDDSVLGQHPRLRAYEGKTVILGIRPEDLEDAALVSGVTDERRIEATIDIREDAGSDVLLHFGVGVPPVRSEHVRAAVGARAAKAVEARAKSSPLLARPRRGTRAREGDRIGPAGRSEHGPFFHPENGPGNYPQ